MRFPFYLCVEPWKNIIVLVQWHMMLFLDQNCNESVVFFFDQRQVSESAWASIIELVKVRLILISLLPVFLIYLLATWLDWFVALALEISIQFLMDIRFPFCDPAKEKIYHKMSWKNLSIPPQVIGFLFNNKIYQNN